MGPELKGSIPQQVWLTVHDFSEVGQAPPLGSHSAHLILSVGFLWTVYPLWDIILDIFLLFLLFFTFNYEHENHLVLVASYWTNHLVLIRFMHVWFPRGHECGALGPVLGVHSAETLLLLPVFCKNASLCWRDDWIQGYLHFSGSC